jgi:hypothetical protein
MKGIWSKSLGVSLGLLVGAAGAEEYQWRPAAERPAATASPAVSLGRPVAMAPAVVVGAPYPVAADRPIVPASFSPQSVNTTLPAVVRAQAPDPVGGGAPPPGPPPSGGLPNIPATPSERFNCGVVTDPPPGGVPVGQGGPGFWGKCGEWFRDTGIGAGTASRAAFQSDHGFDALSSPVSNPFLFEDPRALTEVKPIFMHQGTPLSNSIYHGGDIDVFGLQARVALTERLSAVFSETGLLWQEVHNPSGDFSTHMGVTELRVGPQYTVYRCPETGTIASAGLLLDIPVGPHKILQDTGTVSFQPYVSLGQIWKTGIGCFGLMSTTGYSVAADSKRTDYFWSSFHVDYNVGGNNIIYPFVELNYFHYTNSGTAEPIDFEGRDLYNFGAIGVGGHNSFSTAVGVRFKFSEFVQTGVAYEFPIGGHRDLLDYRITFDVIFRY